MVQTRNSPADKRRLHWFQLLSSAQLSSAQLASMLQPQKIVATIARLLTILLQLVLMSLYGKAVRCRSDWVEQVLIFRGQVIV